MQLIASDFSFTADSNGYMILYKCQPIGGAGTAGRKSYRIHNRRLQAEAYAEQARGEIAKLVSGGGQERFLQVIGRIENGTEGTCTGA